MTKDRQLELPSHLTLLIWELVAATALALIYGPYDMHTAAGYKLYIICRKWVWGLCLAWVTIACVKECILLSNTSSISIIYGKINASSMNYFKPSDL